MLYEVITNLSALLTPYYPLGKELPAKDRAWTPEDLEKWLKNPRKQRPVITSYSIHYTKLYDGGSLRRP